MTNNNEQPKTLVKYGFLTIYIQNSQNKSAAQHVQEAKVSEQDTRKRSGPSFSLLQSVQIWYSCVYVCVSWHVPLS